VTKGIRDEFWKFTQEGSDWNVHRYAAMWRPTWTDQERSEKINMYGSSNHPDYRRNVLGKHGDVANPLFVLTRLMRCVDLDPASEYNESIYHKIQLNAEMIEDRGGEILNAIDIPMSHRKYKTTWAGMDVGFTIDPSEILIFSEDEKAPGSDESMLRLLSRFRLSRISTTDQAKLVLWLFDFYNLNAFAMDKMQPVSEPVLTPDGWKPIGDISVGDFVIGSDGKPTKVEGVYPQVDRRVVEVTFSDGSSTRCGPEHLWSATVKKNGRPVDSGGGAFTTEQLMALKKSGYSVSVPVVEPIEMETKDLPIDPYLLGCLIGDGNIRESGVRFSSVDEEVIDKVRDALPDGHDLYHTDRCNYYLRGSGPKRCGLSGRFLNGSNTVLTVLRELGLTGKLSHEKFIPEQYLRASIDQRLELLKGLMDTDGYSNASGHIGFCSSSESLIDNVRELVWSLGGTATKCRNPVFVRGKQFRDQFKMTIRVPSEFNPFHLYRKAANVKTDRAPIRWLREFKMVDPEESVCIRVAAEDHLYVTKDYLVTHNTGNGLPLFQLIQQQAETGGDMATRVINKELIKGYNFSEKILVDFDASIPIDEMDGDAVSETGIKRNVLEYASDRLREYVDTRRLMMPDDRDLIQEFQGQTFTYDKGGMDQYGRRRYSKGSFHALDAARMAALAHSQYGIEAFMREYSKVTKPEPVYDIFVAP
jgi:hypothetical protein